MRKCYLIPIILALALSAGILPGCAPAHHVYIENLVDVVEVKAAASDYEGNAQELAGMFRSADVACRAGLIVEKECEWLDVLYQEARRAFIAAGDAEKEYIRNPGKNTRLNADNAARKYKFIRAQLVGEMKKNGLEVPE